MNEADNFARTLLEEAKRFLEKAKGETCAEGQRAYLHAALILGFCALEAEVNTVATEISKHEAFRAPHDQAVLLEKEIRLVDGRYKLGGLRMHPLVDRIQFIHQRIRGKSLNKEARWWSDLAAATDLRNRLTHPKDALNIRFEDINKALEATIKATDVLYRAVYKKQFPPMRLRLDSRLEF